MSLKIRLVFLRLYEFCTMFKYLWKEKVFVSAWCIKKLNGSTCRLISVKMLTKVCIASLEKGTLKYNFVVKCISYYISDKSTQFMLYLTTRYATTRKVAVFYKFCSHFMNYIPSFRYYKTLLNRRRPYSTYLLGKNPPNFDYKSHQNH